MSPMDSALKIVGLRDAHVAGTGEPVFIPVHHEPTDRGPLGQEPFDRRRVGSFQFRPDHIEFLLDRLPSQ